MKEILIYILVAVAIVIIVGFMPDRRSATNPHCEGLEVYQETDGKIIIDRVTSEKRYRECTELEFGK